MFVNKIVKIHWLQCTDNIQNMSSSNTLPNSLSSIVIHILCIMM